MPSPHLLGNPDEKNATFKLNRDRYAARSIYSTAKARRVLLFLSPIWHNLPVPSLKPYWTMMTALSRSGQSRSSVSEYVERPGQQSHYLPAEREQEL